MNKVETIKKDSVTRYVIKSKKGNYLTENFGWTKCLKNAYRITDLLGASYMVGNDFKNCKVVEVRLRTWKAVEEIGEVKE